MAKRMSFISAFGESVGYIFFMISDFLMISDGIRRERTIVESGDEISEDVKEILKIIRSDRVMRLMAVAANLADLIIALAEIEPNPFCSHVVTLGISGLVGTEIGHHKMRVLGEIGKAFVSHPSRYVKLTKEQKPTEEDINPGELNLPIDVPQLHVPKCNECVQTLPESYQAPADEPWTTGIFDCARDPESCRTRLFCPCVLFGRNIDQLREDTPWTGPCICHAIFVEGGLALAATTAALHAKAFELYGMLAGNVSPMTVENVKPAYGGEEEAFLKKVVTPIYEVIAREAAISKKAISKVQNTRSGEIMMI
ncbi:hypothetical protein CASFOL_018424 [Castilleja foliolosa]|uniref:1,3-beta-glucan synthase component FKS1-like domain-containing protein n=1 Tax=Castilleja foliolosa TaxID=1961234 RepID=A0ABD3DAJ3_9LAMI